MKKLILATMLSLSFAASATESLYSETSNPGETMDAFAVRIAKDAYRRSMEVSGEICGEFRKEGAAYAITFYTIRHQTQCSYVRHQSHEYTGLTYHTHIYIGLANQYLEQQKLAAPRFSQPDYAHPGYMTTGRIVMFQTGTPESVRKVRRQ